MRELHHSCAAIECKGVAHCERDNRSMACRAFPFYPYITREGEFAGLAYYWSFEETCWVISNLSVVDKGFVDEFVRVHEYLMKVDTDELENFTAFSANMRRVFSRRRRSIPSACWPSATWSSCARAGPGGSIAIAGRRA